MRCEQSLDNACGAPRLRPVERDSDRKPNFSVLKSVQNIRLGDRLISFVLDPLENGPFLHIKRDNFCVWPVEAVFDLDAYLVEKLRIPQGLDIVAHHFDAVEIAWGRRNPRYECSGLYASVADEIEALDDILSSGVLLRLLSREGLKETRVPSGALCVASEVPVGATVTVPFALGWFFPQIEFGSGTRWWRRFTEYFPAGTGQAFEINKDALLNWEPWLNRVEAWQDPIIRNPAYPEWLKQGTLNELYYATFGGSFWENGCITKPKKFGKRSGQHLASVMECQEYSFAETFDVRHHASRSSRDLWPQMERDILSVFADFIVDAPDGRCPHDAGLISGDPFFEYDGYRRSYNQSPNGIKGRITTPWSEFSPKFIQQSHAYWQKTKDDRFLEEVWPRA